MDLTVQLLVVLSVFALLGVTIWLLRGRGSALLSWPQPRRSARRLKTVERLVLTPHHSLHLVQFDDRLLVIGLSPAGCQVLVPDDQGLESL